MVYPIQTRIVVDGRQAASTGPELASGEAVVLDGLSFRWGRQTSVDQPDVGTCSFSLRQQLNVPGMTAPRMLDLIHVGSSVEVWATATVPASNAEVMQATGFAGTGALDPNRWACPSGTVPTVSVTSLHGRRGAWATSTAGSWPTTIIFPPGQFQAPGTAPDAWDLIPQLPSGEAWPITVDLWLPPGTSAQLVGYAYTTPYKSETPTVCPVVADSQPVVVDGTGDWQTLTGFVSLPVNFPNRGAWIAPGVYLNPMPSTVTVGSMSGTIAEQTLSFADYNQAGISLVSLSQQGPSVRDNLVWAGEVTGAVGRPVGAYAMQVDVSASDVGAVLSNTTVSDSPWPAQSVQTRVDRIATLANTPTVTVDTTVADTVLTYREVDAQPALDLLKDVAQSVGGVMWTATHAGTGTYLFLEDPQNRTPVRKFVIDAATGIVSVGGNTAGVSVVSASDVIADQLQWAQDVSQVTTSVDVAWQQQGTDNTGAVTVTAQTATVTDSAAQDTYGLRKMSVDTELTAAADATALAQRLLDQARNMEWTVSGLTVDTQLIEHDLNDFDYPFRLGMIMDLLDGTRRIGRGLIVVDLPSWTPSGESAAIYLDGGEYYLQRGKWRLSLLGSPAASGGQGSGATFNDFVGVDATIADFQDGLRFEGIIGVAGPLVGSGQGFGMGPFGEQPFGY